MKRIVLICGVLLLMIASSSSSFQGGSWYGYANGACCLDRENELKAHYGDFTRITVPYNNGSIYPVALDAVCSYQHKTCIKVGDWEGHDKACNEISQNRGNIPVRDGSRLAYCSAQ